MSSDGRQTNRLLARLSPADYSAITTRAEVVQLKLGDVVCDPGIQAKSVYFPLTNVFSSVVLMQDGSVAEVGTIGREGLSNIGLLVNSASSPTRVLQQIDGDCLRVSTTDLTHLLRTSADARFLMDKYVLTVLQQCGQSAACNLHHTIEERMARWLLATADRVGAPEFFLTQEFLSYMLGVRRQSVNLAGGTLQRAGLIKYSRGNILIVDRTGLESVSCECHMAVIEAYEMLMNEAPA